MIFKLTLQGDVVLGNLPFGRYRLQVSKSGFTTQTVAIDVQSATPVTRTISMEIGAEAVQGGCGLRDAACRNGSPD